jgi:dGTPase
MENSHPGRTAAELEALEDATLAPYAHRSLGATRRFIIDDAGRTLAYRTAYQRDRDRLLHSLSFRRLKNKTQVYVPYEGDHHRTRLTHTLEVAQVGRTIARALGLNEDLVEAIALGHDLGQPPFGAAGHEVLAGSMSGLEKVEEINAEALAASGGFRSNYQSLRVVDRLEQRYDHPGLNLSDSVREGIWKCGEVDEEISYPDWVEEGLAPTEPPSLEAQTVTVADELARLAHDLEDGIRAGEVALEAAERLDLGAAVVHKLGDRYSHLKSRFRRQNSLIRGMIHVLVSDVVVHGWETLMAWRLEWSASAEAEDANRPPVPPRFESGTVGFSESVSGLVDEIAAFVETQVYRSFAVSRMDARGRSFVKGLFAAYYRDPLQLDDYVLLRYRASAGGSYLRDLSGPDLQKELAARYHGNPAFVRLVADHIAGMSDSYAVKEYERLYLPYPAPEGR